MVVLRVFKHALDRQIEEATRIEETGGNPLSMNARSEWRSTPFPQLGFSQGRVAPGAQPTYSQQPGTRPRPRDFNQDPEGPLVQEVLTVHGPAMQVSPGPNHVPEAPPGPGAEPAQAPDLALDGVVLPGPRLTSQVPPGPGIRRAQAHGTTQVQEGHQGPGLPVIVQHGPAQAPGVPQGPLTQDNPGPSQTRNSLPGPPPLPQRDISRKNR